MSNCFSFEDSDQYEKKFSEHKLITDKTYVAFSFQNNSTARPKSSPLKAKFVNVEERRRSRKSGKLKWQVSL